MTTTSQSSPAWIDADAHVLEGRSLWNHLDKKFKDRIQITNMTTDPDYFETPIGFDVAIDGRPIPIWIAGPRQQRFERLMSQFKEKYAKGSGTDPQQYLKDLDVEGLAQVVIYPTLFLWAPWIPDVGAAFSSALAQAYNDWIYEFCGADRKRLHAVAVIALHDVEAAIREAKRCADRGFVGVFVRPNPIYGRTLGHPDYDRLYDVLEDQQLSLGIHEGQLAYLPTLGRDRSDAQWAIHCMSHPFEQMAAMLSLIEHDVFERHPKLKVLFLEAGTAMWVPYWLNRLDAERKLYRMGSAKGLLPTEYFHRQGFATCEVDDPFLPQTLSCIGDKCLLMSTDYPHMESPYPHSVLEFMKQPISTESRDRIGHHNALSAYPRLAT